MDGTSWVNFRNPVGTAAAADVLAGKTFANTGSDSVTGTMTNQGAWTSSPTASGKVTIPAGYHNGSGYVNTAGVYTTGYNAGKSNSTLTLYKKLYATIESIYLPSLKAYKYVYGFHFTNPGKPFYIMYEKPNTTAITNIGARVQCICEGFYSYNSHVCFQEFYVRNTYSNPSMKDGVCYYEGDSDDDHGTYTSAMLYINVYT